MAQESFDALRARVAHREAAEAAGARDAAADRAGYAALYRRHWQVRWRHNPRAARHGSCTVGGAGCDASGGAGQARALSQQAVDRDAWWWKAPAGGEPAAESAARARAPHRLIQRRTHCIHCLVHCRTQRLWLAPTAVFVASFIAASVTSRIAVSSVASISFTVSFIGGSSPPCITACSASGWHPLHPALHPAAVAGAVFFAGSSAASIGGPSI
jgi:hypothetical protein